MRLSLRLEIGSSIGIRWRSDPIRRIGREIGIPANADPVTITGVPRHCAQCDRTSFGDGEDLANASDGPVQTGDLLS